MPTSLDRPFAHCTSDDLAAMGRASNPAPRTASQRRYVDIGARHEFIMKYGWTPNSQECVMQPDSDAFNNVWPIYKVAVVFHPHYNGVSLSITRKDSLIGGWESCMAYDPIPYDVMLAASGLLLDQQDIILSERGGLKNKVDKALQPC